VVKRNPKDLPRHPIGVVTERTGLSAHVLRAWERRYGVVRPRRGENGQRFYRDADIERLGLLQSATRSGRSIASVVSLRVGQLREMAAEDAMRASLRPTPARAFHEQAIIAVRALAPERLGALLRRSLLSLGALPFLEQVLEPLMVEIGTEWHEERITIAQEHAATAEVMRVLVSLVGDLETPDGGPHLMMATPRGERHAVGALMAAAVAAHEGWRVTWLGADLPASQIARAAAQGSVHLVGLSVAAAPPDLKGELSDLRRALTAHVPLVVGGAGAARVVDGGGLTRARDLSHWRALLRLRASKPRKEDRAPSR
jgi:DNA-binding transcriptional MerR regulator